MPYIRVSWDEQEPEVQRARMQAFCDERGWFPVRYTEVAKGTKNDRAEFLRPVSNAMAGLEQQLQSFLVWALDCFGRDQAFMLLQIQSLETAGLMCCYLAEKWLEEDDDSKPILLGGTTGMAATELRRLRRSSMEGQALARSKGKHVGRPSKSLALLQEAARLVVSGECSMRKAAAQVSRGLPKKPEQPGASAESRQPPCAAS